MEPTWFQSDLAIGVRRRTIDESGHVCVAETVTGCCREAKKRSFCRTDAAATVFITYETAPYPRVCYSLWDPNYDSQDRNYDSQDRRPYVLVPIEPGWGERTIPYLDR
jgi:hypothetical protein